MKTIKLLLIAITFFASHQVSAQAWVPVGGGLNSINNNFPNPRGIEANGNQYVAYAEGNQVKVAKWNGLNWTYFPSLPLNQTSLEVRDLEVLPNEDLYLSLNIGGDSGAVYQFTNSAWSRLVQNDFFGGVSDLLYDAATARLYMGGRFTFNIPAIENIGYFSSGTFTNLPLTSSSNNDSVISLSLINSELVATGVFGSFNSDSIPAMVYRGGTWEKFANIHQNFTRRFGYGLKTFEDGGNIYLFTNKLFPNQNINLYRITGNNITLMDSISLGMSNSFFIHHSFAGTTNNGYFISLEGSLVIRALLGNLSILANYPAPVSSISSINNELFYYAEDPPVNTSLYPQNNYAYSTQTNFARVSGTLFLDQNSNCNFEPNEMPVPFGVLNLSQGLSAANFSSGSQGKFSVLVPAGTYNFAIPTNISRKYLRLSTSCTLPTSISLSANQNFQQDIAIEHDGTIDALVDVESYTGQATYGFTENYKLLIQNPGTAQSGLITVDLTIPGTMSFISSVPQSTSVNGNKHTFTFNSLAMFEEKSIQIQLRTDTAGNNLGDTLCLYAQLNGINGDVLPQNNFDTLCLEVRGAYDPNDKTPSATNIKPGTNQVDYRIRFQNTGNSPAVKVTVVDTLDLTLPITSIIMNSASHAYSISVQNNILIWEFDNIMLPDSASDPLGSQGYISFSAGLNPALGLGDSILNDADIYFDFQKPIITNMAKTVIIQNVSLRENTLQQWLNVYPNPAKDKVFIKWKGESKTTLTLINANGQKIQTIPIAAKSNTSILLNNLAAGVYFLHSDAGTYRLLVQ